MWSGVAGASRLTHVVSGDPRCQRASEICKSSPSGRGVAVTVAPHTDQTVNDVLDQLLSNSTVTAIGSALGVAVVALWLAAAWWAYTDAARRTGSIPAALLAAAWVVVSTPLLLPLSLPVYALVRPAESAGERRTRRLAAELTSVLEDAAGPGCFSCGSPVDPAWHRCPTCTTWLGSACTTCGSWSDRTLEVCPFCGNEDRTEPAIEPLEPAAAAASPRRSRLAPQPVGPGRPPKAQPDDRRAAPKRRPLAPARVG
jgi:hypothetical protein